MSGRIPRPPAALRWGGRGGGCISVPLSQVAWGLRYLDFGMSLSELHISRMGKLRHGVGTAQPRVTPGVRDSLPHPNSRAVGQALAGLQAAQAPSVPQTRSVLPGGRAPSTGLVVLPPPLLLLRLLSMGSWAPSLPLRVPHLGDGALPGRSPADASSPSGGCRAEVPDEGRRSLPRSPWAARAWRQRSELWASQERGTGPGGGGGGVYSSSPDVTGR